MEGGHKKPKIRTTLCLVHEHPKILLGLKKRGFGMGRWNGFGGKVEDGETVEEAARRELFEEAGIGVRKIEKAGIIDFDIVSEPRDLEMHIFRCSGVDGKLQESDEMKPQWFHVEKIPLQKMWADDKYWLPLFLAGKKFRAKFFFDGEKSNKIISYDLREVAEI